MKWKFWEGLWLKKFFNIWVVCEEVYILFFLYMEIIILLVFMEIMCEVFLVENVDLIVV